MTMEFLSVQLKLKNSFVASIEDDLKHNIVKFTVDYAHSNVAMRMVHDADLPGFCSLRSECSPNKIKIQRLHL